MLARYKNTNDVYVVAELSANHRQDLQLAKQTIRAIARTGADAVKVQTLSPDGITLRADNEYFTIRQQSPWDGKNLYELYAQTYMPWDWHRELQELTHSLGLDFFASPFDPSSVDFLEKLGGIPFYKIASFEITDIPLIKRVAQTKKPIIISTGIAEIKDIDLAVNTCRSIGSNDISLLLCSSSYPAPIESIQLNKIKLLGDLYGLSVGLSDHSLGSTVAIAATALGARLIEKHFILDRKQEGPDASFSMEEEEFTQMVAQVRDCSKTIQDQHFSVAKSRTLNRQLAKSIFISSNIKKGEKLTVNNIRVVRPGYGLHPQYYEKLIIKGYASCDLQAAQPLREEDYHLQ